MLARGGAQRNPGYAIQEDNEPRRGDRAFTVCRPSGAQIPLGRVPGVALRFTPG
jgi:hypothetical protein